MLGNAIGIGMPFMGGAKFDPNQPLHITDECKVWLDGKDAGQFTLDGTYVDNWACKGSLHADVANTNADATRPTYDINTGRVTFTRTNSTLLQSAAFGAALTQPNTVFIVYKITGDISDLEYVFDGYTALRSAFGFYSGNFRLRTTAILYGGATNANDNIHTALFNGASSEYWINGISVGSGNVGVRELNGIILGSDSIYGDNADAEIMEVIIYNADISDVDRVKIEGYLSKKYDIPVTTD